LFERCKNKDENNTLKKELKGGPCLELVKQGSPNICKRECVTQFSKQLEEGTNLGGTIRSSKRYEKRKDNSGEGRGEK